MKSKTKISKQEQRKTNPELVETIRLAKKNKGWLEVAGIIAGSRKNWRNMNLNKIDKEVKEGETIIIPGKVLSQGEINKKIKIAAIGFSKKAKEKLLKAKSEIILIADEIKKNPKCNGVKILK